MSDTEATLSELRRAPASATGIQRLRVCETSPLDVFIGITRPDDMPVLQLELPSSSAVPAKAFRSRGLTVEAELVGTGSPSDLRYTLSLSDPASQHLFVVVADDLLSVVSSSTTAKAALTGFLGRLRHWSDFFSRQQGGDLSAEEQQGLFGELWILREALAPYGAREAVWSWTGPSGANQDFQWNNRALEVKTTAASPSLDVKISNAKQLDDGAMEHITLAVVEVDRLQNGGTTLPCMVDATRAALAEQDAEAEVEFLDRLASAGYLPAQASNYGSVGYSVRRVRLFAVDEGFPRLVVRDIPNGVGEVKYEIDVSAMSAFERPMQVELQTFCGKGADVPVD